MAPPTLTAQEMRDALSLLNEHDLLKLRPDFVRVTADGHVEPEWTDDSFAALVTSVDDEP